MKIKISATGSDSESGLKLFRYTITPTTVEPSSGTFMLGQIVEVTATEEKEYTISVIAEDNLENTSLAKETKVTASTAMSVEEAKKVINANNLKDYIGTKINYIPEAGGTWRVFYYDKENYFGDGEGTLYLKRDYDKTRMLGAYVSHLPSDGGAVMRQMNPMWRESSYSEINLTNEHCVAGLCDPEQWKTYKTTDAKYAIGAPSVEMFVRAYNVYKQNNVNGNELKCGISNANGYGVAIGNGNLTIPVGGNIDGGTGNVFCVGNYQWLASPSSNGSILVVNRSWISADGWNANSFGYCPVVAITQ